MQLQLSPVWPWPVVILVGLGLAAFSYWTYATPAPRRRLLVALRWTAIALALFALMRPQLVFAKKIKQSSILAILADKSKSMRLLDMWDNKSRWQTLQELLSEAQPALEALAQDVDLRVLRFDRKVHEEALDGIQPDGEQTALGDALQEVLRQSSNRRLAGIVVLSDGANTTGAPPASVARQLAAQSAPVFAFGFGRETASENVRDLAADAIKTNPVVFQKTNLTVRADYLLTGFQNQPIPVRLLIDGVEKARGVLRSGSERGSVELTSVADATGDVKVTIEATPQPGELQPGNNSISTFVTVRSGGIGVLEIEGKYRAWEPKFIRWALDQSPNIELTQVFLLDTAGRAATVSDDLFQAGRYDVIILGDVHSNRFDQRHLEAIAKLVSNGAGLMMLGGYETFGSGNWQETPVGELLPVEMRPSDGQTDRELKVVPTDVGLQHYVLRLAGDPETNRTAWEQLRPLDGGSTWSGLKLGAVKLAETPEGVPLLAAQEFGRGRSIAFAGDTTWRWRFQRDQREEAAKAHARFWRQLVLWLARREEDSGTSVQVRLPDRRVALGQKLPVVVQVQNTDGTPAPVDQVQAVIATPAGRKVPLELFRQQADFQGTFWQTDVAGDYAVQVVAARNGQTVGSQTIKFLVYEEDAEMRQLAADHETLRNLASLTDGAFHSPEELPKFLDKLKQRDLNLEISQPVVERLWDRWQLFLLFLCVVAAEWIVRKRGGMV